VPKKMAQALNKNKNNFDLILKSYKLSLQDKKPS
jgi:hypothetical protein